MTVKRTITVKTSRIAFHRWKDAPQHRAYLRDYHRHVFHIEVEIEVEHNDREIEFHDLQAFVHGCTAFDGVASLDDAKRTHIGCWGCEAHAEHILLQLKKQWNRTMRVSVSEDGECQASITYVP